MTTTTTELKRTVFYEFHLEQGAKMVDFAGWSMPLLYDSIIEEHKQVRNSGGMFDVSHMGRLSIKGKDACRFLDRVCTRQIHGMDEGQARYSLVCNEQGGCRDDVLVYCLGEGDYLMVCNAANRAKLLEHFQQVRGDLTFKLKDDTESTAMVAMQGPEVMPFAAQISSVIGTLKRYRFTVKNALIAKIMISRTGYTGEDGVEIIMPNVFAKQGLKMLFGSEEASRIIKPAGLGARDSLRLEAGMALYGHEITEELDPISAGLNFAVKLNKGEDDDQVESFIGQQALQKIAADGPKRKLVGLFLDSKRAARQDMKVNHNNSDIGFVTSGCMSPTLQRSIAMAYVDAEHAQPGTGVQVDLGRQQVDAEVTALPFYKAG